MEERKVVILETKESLLNLDLDVARRRVEEAKRIESRKARHPHTLRIYVCAACRADGGTLQKSKVDGLYYHPDHLPERS